MKTIVVACGTGVATSTVVNEAVTALLKANGLKANIIQCKISEIESHVDQADLILTSMKVKKDFGKPTLTAIAILTGMGKDVLDQQILDYIK